MKYLRAVWFHRYIDHVFLKGYKFINGWENVGKLCNELIKKGNTWIRIFPKFMEIMKSNTWKLLILNLSLTTTLVEEFSKEE